MNQLLQLVEWQCLVKVLLGRPLDNRTVMAKDIERMKSRGKTNRHASWLRIYAIRLTDGKIYNHRRSD